MQILNPKSAAGEKHSDLLNSDFCGSANALTLTLPNKIQHKVNCKLQPHLTASPSSVAVGSVRPKSYCNYSPT